MLIILQKLFISELISFKFKTIDDLKFINPFFYIIDTNRLFEIYCILLIIHYRVIITQKNSNRSKQLKLFSILNDLIHYFCFQR